MPRVTVASKQIVKLRWSNMLVQEPIFFALAAFSHVFVGELMVICRPSSRFNLVQGGSSGRSRGHDVAKAIELGFTGPMRFLGVVVVTHG